MIGMTAKEYITFKRKVVALCFQYNVAPEGFFGDIIIKFREGGQYGIDRNEMDRSGILTREALGFGNGESTG